jgi:hypothetical protein
VHDAGVDAVGPVVEEDFVVVFTMSVHMFTTNLSRNTAT